jgi:serine/threonine protein kinase
VIQYDRRLIPFKNTILIGELPFTLQYVRRDDKEESLFQVELKAFFSRVLEDNNPFVLPTPQELDERFGEWKVQHPIGKGTFGTVYMVVHSSDGRQAAAKQLFQTERNTHSIEREVEMAQRISKLSYVSHSHQTIRNGFSH